MSNNKQTVTDHDQLAELEPLMKAIDWWPEIELRTWKRPNNSTSVIYTSHLSTKGHGASCVMSAEHALAIVTGRAEKGLVERGWRIRKDWLGYMCMTPVAYNLGTSKSLADALRVEIKRENKKPQGVKDNDEF